MEAQTRMSKRNVHFVTVNRESGDMFLLFADQSRMSFAMWPFTGLEVAQVDRKQTANLSKSNILCKEMIVHFEPENKR